MARSNRPAVGQGLPPPDGRGAPAAQGQRRQPDHGGETGRVLRALALAAVVLGLVVLTAGACLLSYSGVHAFATQAGVTRSLARIYPIICDATLVVAGCSVLALRGAGLVSRIYGWLCFVVLLAALAASSVVHVAGIALPSRAAQITAAVFPWALVLIAFGLLLALLRQARRRRSGRRAALAALAGQPAAPLAVTAATSAAPDVVKGLPAGPVPVAALGSGPVSSGTTASAKTAAEPVTAGGEVGEQAGSEPVISEPAAAEPATPEPAEPEPADQPTIATRPVEMRLRASTRADAGQRPPSELDRPRSSPTPPSE